MGHGCESNKLDLPLLAAKARETFTNRYHRPAEIVVAAPGRVNIIGEHVDYNDGIVLPIAIERYTVIASAIRDDGNLDQSRVYSAEFDEEKSIPVHTRNRPTTEGWARYVEGVLVGCAQRHIATPAFDAVVVSNIPVGGGLSSSAAIEVAMATLAESLDGHPMDPREKALLCQRAEQKFAGLPCGIMDQFSSVFGEENALLRIDCKTEEVAHVPFQGDDVVVLVTNSHVAHALATSGYATRRSQCATALPKLEQNSWRDVSMEILDAHRNQLKPVEYMRGCHVVSEIARTTEAANAFAQSDWSRVGELMYASHTSLRDDYEVSCAELDLLVQYFQDLGPSKGVIGARMTGGGFGGCTVALVDAHAVGAIVRQVHERYHAATGIEASSFTSRPARGAHVVDS